MKTYTDKEIKELAKLGRLTFWKEFEPAVKGEHFDRTQYYAKDIEHPELTYLMLKEDYEHYVSSNPPS